MAAAAALIYDSPVTGTGRKLTYRQLLDEVARFAGVLRGLGTGAGDRVVIYMPMIPEAVIAMLACARIGAVHSVVFGGFAAPELATRIDGPAGYGGYRHLFSGPQRSARVRGVPVVIAENQRVITTYGFRIDAMRRSSYTPRCASSQSPK